MRLTGIGIVSTLLTGALVAFTGCSGTAGPGGSGSDDDDTGSDASSGSPDGGPGDGTPDGAPGDSRDPGPDPDTDGGPVPGTDAGPVIDAAPAIDAGTGTDAPTDAPPVPQTLQVCAAGATFTTVGAAIQAASAGDTIQICAGTYPERLAIMGKALSLVGAGAATTIIDAGAAGTALTIEQTGGAGVTVTGLTFTNGATATEGGGVRCVSSTLQLRDSAVVANRATGGGGGLYTSLCAVDISGTRFEQNDGGPTGGGAALTASTGTVRANQFINNTGVNGAGLATAGGTVVIDGNELRLNRAGLRGGGLYHMSEGTVTGNQVVDNVAGWTGGGVHTVGYSFLFEGNTVRGNSSENDGGGIYVHQGAPTFRANTIAANTSNDDGGGLRMFESAGLVEANIIENNRAGDAGGGVRISHVACTVVNNIVRNNTAGGTGGGYDLDNDASVMRGGEITGNTAGGSGGGVFLWLAPWNGQLMEDVLISGNRAWRGAGLFIDDNFQPITLRRLRVRDNVAGLGGGLMVRATNFTLTDSVFSGNRANTGGAIHHAVGSPWMEPCQVPPCPAPPVNPIGRIDFTVIHNNRAAQGGSALWTNASGLTVENSILFNNVLDASVPAVMVTAPAATPDMTTPPVWEYNNTLPATFAGMADPTGTAGNLSVDPLFTSMPADLSLQPGSACRDAGNPSMLDPDGTRADMGLVGGAP